MAEVLVVDDDVTVREVVVSYLRAGGHEVTEASDGEAALASMRRDAADLVVLDLMLPGMGGIEVCRRLRDGGEVPIIMLTALGTENDRLTGLRDGRRRLRDQAVQPARAGPARRLGAAPGRPEELPRGCASSTATSSSTPAEHTATLGGVPLTLTVREFDLLHHLVANPRTVWSREELLRDVWGWSFGDQSTVTVHVRRLREKVEAEPTRPARLVTVWGVGYRWEPS